MATKKVSIKLRRDTINNYASHASHVPLKGEVCIVDPTATSPWATSKRIRIKIGDGNTSFGELPYADQQNSNVFAGYYFEGSFYYDASHSEELVEEDTEGVKFYDFGKMIFIDLHTGVIYTYINEQFIATTAQIPGASEAIPGILKLYQSLGQNTDGTMSQKAITDAIDRIRFSANDDGVLVLTNPVDERSTND